MEAIVGFDSSDLGFVWPQLSLSFPDAAHNLLELALPVRHAFLTHSSNTVLGAEERLPPTLTLMRAEAYQCI